jgi:PleD family two-component response regulator
LRLDIEEYLFEEIEHLTCSFGVTAYNIEDDAASFLKRVDDALYEAKESGRNRIVLK